MTTSCSVNSCWGRRGSKKHRFPNPDKEFARFNEWVKLTGNKRLTTEMTPSKVYNNYRVCSYHFQPTDFITNGKLKKGIVPSNLLPDPLINGFSSAQSTSEVLPSTSDIKCSVETTISKQVLSPKKILQEEAVARLADTTPRVYKKGTYLRLKVITSDQDHQSSTKSLEEPQTANLLSDPLINGFSSEQSTSENDVFEILPRDIKCNVDAKISRQIFSPKKILQEEAVARLADTTPRVHKKGTYLRLKVITLDQDHQSSTKSLERHQTLKNNKLCENVLSMEEEAVARLANITPRVYKKGANLRVKVLTSDQDRQSSTRSPEEPQILKNNKMCEKVMSSMERIIARFFKAININRKNKQYSLEDKALALVLYRQASTDTCYRSLSRLFPLPSKKTLLNLLHRISIRPGVHEELFAVLQAETKQLKNPLDRYCVLLCNEMSIQPHLSPNLREGSIQGFEDFGYKKTDEIADHVQVFVLRGVSGNWNIPVYYNFINGRTQKDDLVNNIKMIIRKCKFIGIHVVSYVCDHAANNRAAIDFLVKETREKYRREGLESNSYDFEVDGTNVIPLFDVPHLFKGLRNNLAKYNLSYIEEGKIRIGKWEDILTAYRMDSHFGSLCLMPKLTEGHVNPKQMDKISVTKCVEVFSHSVAVAVNAFAFSGTVVNMGEEDLKLEKSALDTASLLGFFDQLFDSLNGDTLNPPEGKQLRSAITKNSQHVNFWEKATEKLKTFKFIKNNTYFTSPSLKHLITTITNFEHLFNKLKALGFTYLLPRTFNLDPLGKYFGNMRQGVRRHMNPTTKEFTQFYKSLLVDGLLSRHSVGINCEDDNGELVLALQRLVCQGLSKKIHNTTSKSTRLPLNITNSIEPIQQRALRYLAGYLDKELAKQQICDCKNFYFELTDGSGEPDKHSKGPKLRHMNNQFLKKIRRGLSIIKYIFNRDFHERGVLTDILKIVCSNISFAECCHDEKIKKAIFRYFIKLKAFNYCAKINGLLKGSDLKSIPVNDSKIFKAARKMYLKSLKRQKAFSKRRTSL